MIGCGHRSARSLLDIALRSRRRFDHVFVSSAARVLTFLIGLLMGRPRIILRITHRDRFAPRVNSGFFSPAFWKFFSPPLPPFQHGFGAARLIPSPETVPFFGGGSFTPPRSPLFWVIRAFSLGQRQTRTRLGVVA